MSGAPKVVISLDFELRWGLYDILGTDTARYRENLEGVREVVPRLLEAFAARDVGVTWATVGAVACESWDEWRARSPEPARYDDAKLRWKDVYPTLDPTGRVHFAKELVDEIAKHPEHELGSHTFNHVFVREPGFSRADAIADADAMVKLFADRWKTVPRSLVFPRNQIGFNDVFAERGVTAFRDNPRPFYWNANAASDETRTVRALRMADSLAPLGRRAAPSHAHRASFFVRMNLPKALYRLHQRRIVREAAHLRDGETLHLWWHPHNQGAQPAFTTQRIADLVDAIREVSPRVRFVPMRDAAAA